MQRLNFTRRPSGFSLIDSLIALSVTSVVLGSAVPGFKEASERRHLEGAAAQLETDIQLARSEAVLRDHTLRIGFKSEDGHRCYIVHTGHAGDCTCGPTGQPVCVPGVAALRYAHFDSKGPVQLRSNVSSILLDPQGGTVTPTGTFRFVGNAGREVRIVVNIMGRARACTPSPNLSGYKAC